MGQRTSSILITSELLFAFHSFFNIYYLHLFFKNWLLSGFVKGKFISQSRKIQSVFMGSFIQWFRDPGSIHLVAPPSSETLKSFPSNQWKRKESEKAHPLLNLQPRGETHHIPLLVTSHMAGKCSPPSNSPTLDWVGNLLCHTVIQQIVIKHLKYAKFCIHCRE